MKNNSSRRPNAIRLEPCDDVIRDYAYHLYRQGNGRPGHEVDHWLEAAACLKANVPPYYAHSQLYQPLAEPTHDHARLKSA